jgi:predicted nucleotidyltransferase/DNA-binding XRE family transcriptional regulator
MGIIRQSVRGSEGVFLPYISHVLKKERVSLGIPQKEFARILGVGLKTLRKIEQGNLNVNFKKLNFIFNCLGLTLTPGNLVTSRREIKKKIWKQKDILDRLEKLYPIFNAKYGLNEMALFGSYAWGEGITEDSDIDIMVGFEGDINLEIEGQILIILENIFEGKKVDLVLKNEVKKVFKKSIEESKISVGQEI